MQVKRTRTISETFPKDSIYPDTMHNHGGESCSPPSHTASESAEHALSSSKASSRNVHEEVSDP